MIFLLILEILPEIIVNVVNCIFTNNEESELLNLTSNIMFSQRDGI